MNATNATTNISHENYKFGYNFVGGAGETPSFQLDGGLKLQGRSSSMRLLGWPAAIFSSVSLIQA